ncbi:MAG: 1-deoxy-D-xylulose 5-phosphate reductoisomerase [Maribacter sp.]|jgi:1-deoxy-D-xylulose 5-phosphate reductoisomerase
MHEDNTELTQWITTLKTVRNEVAVLQIMGKNELEFDYTGTMVFEDLETGKRVKVDAKQAKSSYTEAMNKHLETVKNTFLSNGIGFELFRSDAPMEEALQLFLKKRIRLN